MKKVIMFLLVAGTCTTAAVAQDTTKSATPKMEKSLQMKDCVMMKDGKLMVMKSGSVTPLDKELTLSNGSIISLDGTVKATDGTKLKLKEGEAIGLDGKLITKKEMPM
jgi:hypothetical protein